MKNISLLHLQRSGFINIKYPSGLRLAVLEIIRTWKEFVALPQEVKEHFPYSNTSRGAGYECKKGTGLATDKKENFDIYEGEAEWLIENAESSNNRIVKEFITRGLILTETLKPLITSFAQMIEHEFDISGFGKEIEDGSDFYFNRFIYYPPGAQFEEEVATAHVDQSGFTLHLFESAPGLQCLTLKDKKWIDMPISEGETVIIPDMQLQLRSKGKLRALCHRVVATKETSITGRFSAVCFIGFKDTPSYNKKEKGRLQEKTPGFNYEMPFSEFREYFRE